MKKNELVAIACLLCFCCCNGTEKEVPNPDLQEELSPIQFTIDLQKEVLPFPVTKSIPELNIPDIIGKTKSTVFQNKKYKKNHGVLNTIYIIHKTTRSPFQNEAFQF